MDSLYKVDKIFSKGVLDEIREYCEDCHKMKCGVGSGVGEHKYDDSFRKTDIYQLRHTIFPEYCEEIETYFNNECKVTQLDCLVYYVGYHFAKHLDSRDYNFRREWSTITLLDKSPDLEGGDLIIYNSESDETGSVVKLDVGDTILFKSNEVYHQVNKVTSGWRRSLVTWLF